MNLSEIIAGIIFMIPLVWTIRFAIRVAVKQNGGPTPEYLRLVRVWESIAIVFGRPRPVVPDNTKMTLDELGMTLWEASDAHYDKKQLDRIRESHKLEHRLWLNFAGNDHWDDEQRELVGLPRKLTPAKKRELGTAEQIVIRDWDGRVIRKSIDPWDEDDDRTIAEYNCDRHPKTQSCYYCEKPELKRQRRNNNGPVPTRSKKRTQP